MQNLLLNKILFSFAWQFLLVKLVWNALIFLDKVNSTIFNENVIKLYDLVGKSLKSFKQIFLITDKPEDFLIENYNFISIEIKFREVVFLWIII